MAAPTTALPSSALPGSALPGSDAAPIPAWGFALMLAAVSVLWLVTFEGGLVSQALGQAGSFFHELFHDGRHLLGVPCH